MPTTHWERRISHIVRRVSPLKWKGPRRQRLKAAIKRLRKQPSRNFPSDLLCESLRLEFAKRRGVQPDPDDVRRLEWRLLRHRLLERKRAKRNAARSRVRRSVDTTKIFLWRRRRDWLREVESARANAASTSS